MTTAPPLTVAGAVKRFGDVTVLAGFDLAVHPAEIVGFVGPNGAGKSTLLRILVGLVPRDGGAAALHGLDPARSALEIRRRTSYLPGETSVYPQMTGSAYLDFCRGFYPQRRALHPDVAAEFAVPLGRRIRSYSAGMKQKLALTAALTADVPLYMLDEPDRALDATARLALRDAIRALRNEGRAVLLSSHHLAEVEALADRTTFIFRGRNIAPDEVAATRAELRDQVRVVLARPIELPPGLAEREDAGPLTIRGRVDGDPLDWLSRLPHDAVLSAEIGATRLEEVYARLDAQHAAGASR